MFFRQFNRFIIAAAFAATMAAAQTNTTGTVTETSNTPPVGLASSETAQINLVNIASPVGGINAASCTGTVTFLNSSGTAIGPATPFSIASGVIQSVSLPFSNSGATGVRTEIRAIVSRAIAQGQQGQSSVVPCYLQFTLETYDTSTGVTHVFLANGNVAFPVVGVGSFSARVPSH